MTEDRERRDPPPKDDPSSGRSIPRGTDEHADPKTTPESDEETRPRAGTGATERHR